MNEAIEILKFLKRNATFYSSAIELDIYSNEEVDGEEIEKWIDRVLYDNSHHTS